jgi:hypothetical protein
VLVADEADHSVIPINDEPYCWEQISSGDCRTTPRTRVVEPDGKTQLAAVGQFRERRRLTYRQNRRQHRHGKYSEPTGIAVYPQSAEPYVTFGQFGQRRKQIAVIDTRTDRVEGHLSGGATFGRYEGVDDIAVTPNGKEAFLSSFAVVTPGSYGPVTLRGVVLVNLTSGTAGPAVSFGKPVSCGTSTGPVVFGN